MKGRTALASDASLVQHQARRSVALVYLFAVLAALVLAASSARAETGPGDRATASATFERSLAGWRGHRAVVRLVHAGRHGRAASVSMRRRSLGAPSFSIYHGRTLRGRPAGTVVRAHGWVRGAAAGHRICLRIREVVGSRDIVRRTRCVRTTGRWQRVGAVSLRKRLDASVLRVVVSKRRTRGGNRFWVDGIRVKPRPPKPKTDPTPPPPPPSEPPAAPPPSPEPPAAPPPAPAPAPPPAPAPAATGPAFGTQFHCLWRHYTNADRVAVLDKLKAAGVAWVRLDLGWYGIEDAGKGARNAWYIGNVDYCVNEATKRGIKVLATLWLTPGWANGGRVPEAPPSNPQDYADFARWAAEYWRGRISAWEVWNEPDPHQSFWQGSVAQYVALLKAAYPALKAGDPNATVVLGGPSSNDHAWIRDVYAAGAKGSFDALATHPYQGIADQPPEAPTDGNRWWFTNLPAVRKVMTDYGDDKPIWFTEMGWSAHANWSGVQNWERGVSDAQQGDYLVRSVQYTKANYPYVPVMFWYKERRDPAGTNVHLEGYALLNADLTERPVYGTLKSFLAR